MLWFLLVLLLQHSYAEESDFWSPEALLEEWAIRDVWQFPEEVIDALPLEPGQVVADVGAGKGYFSYRLARAAEPDGRVLAIDINSTALEINEEMASRFGVLNLSSRVVYYKTPGLVRNEVDMVFICRTWHYLTDRMQYATKLWQGIRDTGFLAVIGFGTESKPRAWQHNQTTDRFEVQREAESAGFVLHANHDFLPRQFFLVFKKGRAEIFDLLEDFQYISSNLAIGTGVPDSTTMKALQERGFLKTVDLRLRPSLESIDPSDDLRAARISPLRSDTPATLAKWVKDPRVGIVYAFGDDPKTVAQIVMLAVQDDLLRLTEFEEERLQDLLDR